MTAWEAPGTAPTMVTSTTQREIFKKGTMMLRWILLIAAAIAGGNLTQQLFTNHGFDVWVTRGLGIVAVGLITLIGYLLFLKPVPERG
ncbi:hypothetical protein [Arachnia propionica]|uniref:Uncharacterized protein n=1 Tax=Arachnia propionica TaxID=1750 RepID=A0A3P1WSJ8_9ACTN|nr:hypothetical protein [Arachnia propionica]RRD48936.1 hypothetical protein EII35_10535 [Arachnia propionica]